MKKIDEIRDDIDAIDTEVIILLSKRAHYSLVIGELKSQYGIEVLDGAREKSMMNRYNELSLKYKISPNFIKKLFKLIIANSRDIQNENSHK